VNFYVLTATHMSTFPLKWFYNWYYKFRPPEAVSYWKYGDAARAKVGTNEKTGEVQMEIEGEKHAYPGFPRGPVLMGPLARVKKKLKEVVLNRTFAELEKMAADTKYEQLPPDKMNIAVREFNRVLIELEDAEIVGDMKKRMKNLRKVLIFFLQEDDAYRMRWQWIMERLNMKKVKLTKADKYYFRGKYFKVDHHKFDY